MKCPKCEFENAEDAVFCINCGLRLDGNVTCPKCRESIPAESLYCPKCGNKIPHSAPEADVEVKRSFAATKAKIDPIFQIVFTAVSLGILIASLFCVFFSVVKYSGNEWYLGTRPGTIAFYLWGQWPLVVDKWNATGDAFARTSIIYSAVVTCLSSINCVVVTYLFGIKGIIAMIKQLTKGDKCIWQNQQSVITVLCVFLGTQAMIASFSSVYGTSYDAGSAFSIVTSVAITLFFVAMVYSAFRSFDKNNISLFVQKVVFSLCFFFLISIISVLGSTYFASINSTNTVVESLGVNSFFVQMFANMGSFLSGQTGASVFWAAMMLSFASLVVFLSLVVMSTTLLGYFLYGYLTPSERSLGFKLPFYVVSTVFMIMSTIYLVFSIVTAISFASLMSPGPGEYFLPGQSSIVTMICSIMVSACSMVSFFMLRQYSHNERLIKQNQL